MSQLKGSSRNCNVIVYERTHLWKSFLNVAQLWENPWWESVIQSLLTDTYKSEFICSDDHFLGSISFTSPSRTHACACRRISIRKYIVRKLSFLSLGAREETRGNLIVYNNGLIFRLKFSNRDCCIYVNFHGGTSVCVRLKHAVQTYSVLMTASKIVDKIDLWTLSFSEFKIMFTTSVYLELEGCVLKLLNACLFVLCPSSHLKFV